MSEVDHFSSVSFFDVRAERPKAGILFYRESGDACGDEFDADGEFVYSLPVIGRRHDASPAMPCFFPFGHQLVNGSLSVYKVVAADAEIAENPHYRQRIKAPLRGEVRGACVVDHDRVDKSGAPVA